MPASAPPGERSSDAPTPTSPPVFSETRPMSFAAPRLLWLLALAPLAAVAAAALWRRRLRADAAWAARGLWDRLLPSFSRRPLALSVACLTLSVAGTALALARPRSGGAEEKVE